MKFEYLIEPKIKDLEQKLALLESSDKSVIDTLRGLINYKLEIREMSRMYSTQDIIHENCVVKFKDGFYKIDYQIMRLS